MELISAMNLVTTVSLLIMALGCYVVTQAIKLSQIKLANKYLPFVSMIVGIIAGLLVGYFMHEADLGKSAIAGFLVGSATAGLFTGFKGIAGGYDTNKVNTTTEDVSVWKPTNEQQNNKGKED
ncbi:holin [Lactobacillus terrae]|uniref:holin n=1 Tax=Lactobacillus terrae TaxID=2269374 RepID=UPI000C1B7953|nr:holin [Lactobacillus terrae]